LQDGLSNAKAIIWYWGAMGFARLDPPYDLLEGIMSDPAEAEIVRHRNPLMLPESTTVMQAARHMHTHHASAVLVTEGDANLIGIFTERDAISRVLAAGRDPVATTLADVMTNNPETISPQTTATEVLRLMQAAHCRHLPVVHDGKAVGIVSRNDFPALDPPAPPASSV
jgi:CBS domain-containing protein